MAGYMVDRATSDTFIDPDRAMNNDICDICSSDSGQSKDVVKALKQRIGHKNPKVQLLALTLLETLVENCGDMLHMHVAEADILHEMVKIVKEKSDPDVRDKVFMLIDSWQKTFGGAHARYPQYNAAYHELVHADAEFPKRLEKLAPLFNSQSQTAMDMRILDQQGAANDFLALSMSEIQNARGIMDVLAEMLNALHPRNKEGLRQEVIAELVDQCRTYQQRVVQLINTTTDKELMSQGLALNDDLQRVLAKHDAIAAGIAVQVEKKPKSLQALVETEDPINQDPQKQQGLIDITSQDTAKERNQRTVLPDPDFTIVIDEDTTDPFQYKAQEIREWLAKHGDAEDLLDGEHANEETIEDFDELTKLGRFPFLERQMRKLAPLRWLHLKLQLARDQDCWFGLVFRADTVYMKGFRNRPNGGAETCFEITELLKRKRKLPPHRPRLFPQQYNARHLPWDLKYCQMLGCDSQDEGTIFRMLKEMVDDPTFIARAIQYFSFLDPADCDPGVAKKLLAGVTFKFCEPLRMRVTMDIPALMNYVWGWNDICVALRKWKDHQYDSKIWNEIKSTETKTPREALEVILLLLNRLHNAILYADSLKAIALKKEEQHKYSPKKLDKGSSAAKKRANKGSGASTSKGGGCCDGNVPFGRCRIQVLKVRANFEVDTINIYDWHRGQTIYTEAYGYVGQENTSLILCGPSRPIGAYGYMCMEIFPAAPNSDPVIDFWDVSDYLDAEVTPYEEVVYGRSEQRQFISYLHIPNAIEAKIQVLLHCGESCEVSGFVKATATGYQDNYVEIFVKENEEKVSVPSGEWLSLPLLVDVFCLPYKRDVEIKLDVGLNFAQPGRRPRRFTRTLVFTSKYEKQEIKIDTNKGMEVVVSMHPDPLALADVVAG